MLFNLSCSVALVQIIANFFVSVLSTCEIPHNNACYKHNTLFRGCCLVSRQNKLKYVHKGINANISKRLALWLTDRCCRESPNHSKCFMCLNERKAAFSLLRLHRRMKICSYSLLLAVTPSLLNLYKIF